MLQRLSFVYRESGRSSPGAIDDQELLFHEQAVGDDCLCATRPEEFGDRYQKMEEECQQILHGSAAWGMLRSGARLSESSFLGENCEFAIDSLRARVASWSVHSGLHWDAEEISAVTGYLDRRFYQLVP